jgi:hypothetical protein
LHAGALSRNHQEDHAGWALDIHLSGMPALGGVLWRTPIIDKAERGSYLTKNSV